MKKILLTIVGFLGVLTLMSQPPRNDFRRPLPNQFRDFLDHQQSLYMERPQIEKKGGKVIITMSEEQFKRMKQHRIEERYRMINFRPQPVCQKCQRHHGKPHRKKS